MTCTAETNLYFNTSGPPRHQTILIKKNVFHSQSWRGENALQRSEYKVSATTRKTCAFEDVDDVVPVFSKMLT